MSSSEVDDYIKYKDIPDQVLKDRVCTEVHYAIDTTRDAYRKLSIW